MTTIPTFPDIMPDNLKDEFREHTDLFDNSDTITASGDIIFISTSSGITYSTELGTGDPSKDIYINNKGEEGLLYWLEDDLVLGTYLIKKPFYDEMEQAFTDLNDSVDENSEDIESLQYIVDNLNLTQLALESQTINSGVSIGNSVKFDTSNEWVKSSTPDGIYVGNNKVVVNGIAEIQSLTFSVGYTYFAQADGTISLTTSSYPIGKAVELHKLLIDINPKTTNPLAYDGIMTDFYSTPGGNGKIRLKVSNAGLSDGTEIRRKISAWEAGDDRTTGTQVAVITDDSSYNGANKWYEDDNLVNGVTYYYKAFPYLGAVYNETIGVNETYARAGLLLNEYTADNVSGNTVIDSVGLNNASCTGVTFEGGKIGNTAIGTGSGYANLNSSISPSNKAISFWLYHDNSGRCGVIGNSVSDQTSGISPQIYADGDTLYVGIWDYSSAGTFSGKITTLTAGWNHVVANFISTTSVTVYVNGILVGSGNIDNTVYGGLNYTFNRMYWAFKNTYGGLDFTAYLNGKVDQVRVYSTNLNTDEISKLYNGGAGC